MYAENSEGVTQNSTTAEPSAQNRRSFLGALLALGSVFVGALLSVPLIRFAIFPLIRRTTDLKNSPVGSVSEFSSLTEPAMRTIQIEQIDGWRKTVSEKAVYITKDQRGQLCVLIPYVRISAAPCRGTKKRNSSFARATAALFHRTALASAGHRNEAWTLLRLPFRTANCWCASNISGNWCPTRKSSAEQGSYPDAGARKSNALSLQPRRPKRVYGVGSIAAPAWMRFFVPPCTNRYPAAHVSPMFSAPGSCSFLFPR